MERSIRLKRLMLNTLIATAVIFTMMVISEYFDDPDPFDPGSVVFFLIIAAVSQAVSVGFYYSKLLLNTYPHVLSNVIAIMLIYITIVAVS
jgi:hypothetical protein